MLNNKHTLELQTARGGGGRGDEEDNLPRPSPTPHTFGPQHLSRHCNMHVQAGVQQLESLTVHTIGNLTKIIFSESFLVSIEGAVVGACQIKVTPAQDKVQGRD